jgi:GTPase SAR1 family protein
MIRLLIVGESSVGKTSLLIRFNEGEVSIDYGL